MHRRTGDSAVRMRNPDPRCPGMGVRVQVGAGVTSFRREERLQKLLEEAQQKVEELRRQMDVAETVGGG